MTGAEEPFVGSSGAVAYRVYASHMSASRTPSRAASTSPHALRVRDGPFGHSRSLRADRLAAC
eukprot:1282836-Prymnesium_polylepis.1